MSTLVRIIKNYRFPGEQNYKSTPAVPPDLLRQTPEHRGVWNDLIFTESPVKKCDYAVILNKPASKTEIDCPPERVWAIIQEPPNEYYKSMHRGDRQFQKIFTTDQSLKSKRYSQNQPATPWLVNRDFDSLINCKPEKKTDQISWITSKLNYTKGHQRRLNFLEQIQTNTKVNLFGRDFIHLEDKWNGLAPYRYSLAIENYSCPHYWTEKIADCFLAWTMPIYWGCTNLSDYFPSDSYIQIDIEDPSVYKKINEITKSGLQQKHLDAIDHARKLVLNKYQLFPFIESEIIKEKNAYNKRPLISKKITLSEDLRYPNFFSDLTRGLL